MKRKTESKLYKIRKGEGLKAVMKGFLAVWAKSPANVEYCYTSIESRVGYHKTNEVSCLFSSRQHNASACLAFMCTASTKIVAHVEDPTSTFR